MRERADERAMTPRDVGNGLALLGGILLAIYLVFVVLPPSLYAEYTEPVWERLAVSPAIVLGLVAFIAIGLALRVTSPRGAERHRDDEDE